MKPPPGSSRILLSRVIFSEDPRYYRLAHGATGKRVLHAAEHAFVGHHDDGTRMFNYSEWLGTSSAAALTYAYRPGNQRGLSRRRGPWARALRGTWNSIFSGILA